MRILVAATFVALFVQGASAAEQGAKRVWVLKSAGGWCAYGGEAGWRAGLDADEPLQNAVVDLKAGRIVAVNQTVQSEAGDWILNDQYAFGPGDAVSVSRELVTASQDAKQVVEIKYKAMREVGRTSGVPVHLTDGRADRRLKVEWPKVKVVRRADDLEYASLAGRTAGRRAGASRVCQP